MRRNRRVKVVATLGPASSATEMIERLFLAGVDVFRINMSHSSHETARALQNSVRWVAKRHRHPIGILGDLQGPKFRVGEFPGGRAFVNDGAIFRFEQDEKPGSSESVYLPHPQIFAAVEPGHMLLLDDGKIRMRVIEKKPGYIAAQVLVGGALGSRKGISLPDTLLPVGPLTDKDRADLAHLLKIGVDWIALSFVQRAADIHGVRKIVGERAAILAKIEKPSAVADLDAIVAAADGIMVARGDLGVEIPGRARAGPAEADHAQGACRGQARRRRHADAGEHDLPRRCRRAPRSPTSQPRCSTAPMRSCSRPKSAIGQFPLEAIQMMDRIAIEVESDPSYDAIVHATRTTAAATGADAIAAAAHAIADTVKLSAIVCYTATGSTALRVTRERPGLPIIGLTPVEATARRLVDRMGHPVGDDGRSRQLSPTW